MSILTQIVAAEEDEIVAVGESLRPLDEWSGIEMRDVDTAKIVTLHCLLTGDLFDDVAAQYEPLYVSSEEAIVLQLAEDVCEKLAELDEDQVNDVAAELAATEDFEAEGWEPEAINDMLVELCELARLADSQGQSLLVWMHPLRT